MDKFIYMYKKLIIALLIFISCKTEYKTLTNPESFNTAYNLEYKRKSLLKSDTAKYNYKLIINNNCNYYIESANHFIFYINDSLYTFYKNHNKYIVQKRNKYFSFVRPICRPYKEMFRDSTIITVKNDTIRVEKINKKKNSFKYAYFINDNRIVSLEKTINYLGYDQYEKLNFTNFKKVSFNIENELNIKLKNYKKYSISKNIGQVKKPFFFTGRYLNGDNFNSQKDTTNNVIYFFWHKKCFPCILSLPKMNNLYNTYKGNIKIIGVNMFDKIQIIDEMIKQKKIIFPNVIADSIFIKERIKAFPYYVLIHNKKILYESSGYSNEQFNKLDSIIQKLIIEK